MINTPSALRAMISNAEAANVPSKRLEALRRELRIAEQEEASFDWHEDEDDGICHFESNDNGSEVYISDEPLRSSSKKRLKKTPENSISKIKSCVTRFFFSS